MAKVKDRFARALANKARLDIAGIDEVSLKQRLSTAESKLSTIASGANVNRTESEIISIIEASLGMTLSNIKTRIEALEAEPEPTQE